MKEIDDFSWDESEDQDGELSFVWNPNDKTNYMSKLDDSIVTLILANLPPVDLARSWRVCKLWKKLGSEDSIWNGYVDGTFSLNPLWTNRTQALIDSKKSGFLWLDLFKELWLQKKQLSSGLNTDWDE
eukprot:TRINITY_DN1376_c0_g2_i2.p1 TRINITY_DN1376_c0_g2~~TRINITY_DN1376_c0_g2_i2.p1  ORF type:complete len:128 (-),score=38.22 TRINITY_DN1376_c0_g2_i2:70-453(-)